MSLWWVSIINGRISAQLRREEKYPGDASYVGVVIAEADTPQAAHAYALGLLRPDDVSVYECAILGPIADFYYAESVRNRVMPHREAVAIDDAAFQRLGMDGTREAEFTMFPRTRW